MNVTWLRSLVKRNKGSAIPSFRKFNIVTVAKFAATTRKLAPLLQNIGIEVVTWSWEKFLVETSLPFGAWAITDFDRVHPWNIEVAAQRYDALIAAGAPVMNDPRRFLTRAPLIRSLYALGINRYTCWLPAFGEVPARFPVFLRTLSAHRGVISDLLPDPEQAGAALTIALAEGYTITDLAFIEYRAKIDPVVGNFQKRAAYRIGNHIIPALTSNDTHWMSKIGIAGLASAATYDAELAEMTDYPHTTLIRQVTDLCGSSFGRIDFGMVDGMPEVYELNSNPNFYFTSDDHPSAARVQTDRRIIEQLLTAFDDTVPKDTDHAPVDLRHLTVWPKDKP